MEGREEDWSKEWMWCEEGEEGREKTGIVDRNLEDLHEMKSFELTWPATRMQ